VELNTLNDINSNRNIEVNTANLNRPTITDQQMALSQNFNEMDQVNVGLYILGDNNYLWYLSDSEDDYLINNDDEDDNTKQNSKDNDHGMEVEDDDTSIDQYF